MNDSPVFDTLCELLNTAGARFRVLEHPAEGKSDAIAALRGTRPEQARRRCSARSRMAAPPPRSR